MKFGAAIARTATIGSLAAICMFSATGFAGASIPPPGGGGGVSNCAPLTNIDKFSGSKVYFEAEGYCTDAGHSTMYVELQENGKTVTSKDVSGCSSLCDETWTYPDPSGSQSWCVAADLGTWSKVECKSH